MFYQDCIMKPDEEVGIYFLLGRFYVQLHKRFVETKKADGTNSFAVSFPDYSKRGIGSRIRIFSDSPLHLQNSMFRVFARDSWDTPTMKELRKFLKM